MAQAVPPGAALGVTIAAPHPVRLERVREQWDELRHLPELACIEAWSAACRAWWLDDGDHRHRDRALSTLLLNSEELDAWLARPFGRSLVVDGHRHVTSQRAGVERDLSRRRLVASELRTTPVFTEHRGGARTVFCDAEDVPALLDQLAQEGPQWPDSPILRAALLTQAIGAIHPFHDANGGTSRFLASLELVRAHLPPLVLTHPQRNRTYIDGLMVANRTGSFEALSLVLHTAVQQTIGAALFADTGRHAIWDAESEARAERWIGTVDERVRAVVGDALQLERADPAPDALGPVLARLVRRRYRLPIRPIPRCAHWQLRDTGVHLDVAITPLRGGPTSWLVAMLAASVGDDGGLGAVHGGEPVSALFVAPENEVDAIVDPRFLRWLDVRLDQSVRGLAPWM